MEARQEPRFQVRLRSSQSADNYPPITGMVVDMSLHGCRLSSTAPVTAGMVFTLRLEVPGCEEPIQIERAEVRWVRGMEFGLSFLAFTTKAYDRLVDAIHQFRHQSNESALPQPSCFSSSP